MFPKSAGFDLHVHLERGCRQCMERGRYIHITFKMGKSDFVYCSITAQRIQYKLFLFESFLLTHIVKTHFSFSVSNTEELVCLTKTKSTVDCKMNHSFTVNHCPEQQTGLFPSVQTLVLVKVNNSGAWTTEKEEVSEKMDRLWGDC